MEMMYFVSPNLDKPVHRRPLPHFFFGGGEGASVHRLDLEVYDHIANNEIATKNSTRHQRNRHQELDSPPTKSPPRTRLATDEIATKNSTHHRRNRHQELDSPPTNNSERIDTVEYLGLLTYDFTFSSSLFEFEVDPNTNVERLMLLIMQTLIIHVYRCCECKL